MHDLRFAIQFLQSFTKRLRKLSFCTAHCALWIHLFSIAGFISSKNVNYCCHKHVQLGIHSYKLHAFHN
jgi:hypothetical protein